MGDANASIPTPAAGARCGRCSPAAAGSPRAARSSSPRRALDVAHLGLEATAVAVQDTRDLRKTDMPLERRAARDPRRARHVPRLGGRRRDRAGARGGAAARPALLHCSDGRADAAARRLALPGGRLRALARARGGGRRRAARRRSTRVRGRSPAARRRGRRPRRRGRPARRGRRRGRVVRALPEPARCATSRTASARSCCAPPP